MNRYRTALLLALLVLSAGAGARERYVTDPNAPRALPEEGPVSVAWSDPRTFTELRYSQNSWAARRGDWVRQLAQHLRERAEKRLPPGERLQVDITDIQLAGDFEPWHGPQFYDVRVVRDLYPPRMTLVFQHFDANGAVIDQGERKLTDPGFLMNTTVGRASDPLRFEKALIDRWLSRELPAPARDLAGP